LKVRESDSPFLLKRRSDSKEAGAESMSTKQPLSLRSSFASSVNSERSAAASVTGKLSKEISYRRSSKNFDSQTAHQTIFYDNGRNSRTLIGQ